MKFICCSNRAVSLEICFSSGTCMFYSILHAKWHPVLVFDQTVFPRITEQRAMKCLGDVLEHLLCTHLCNNCCRCFLWLLGLWSGDLYRWSWAIWYGLLKCRSGTIDANVLSSAALGCGCFEPSPFPRVDDIFQAWPAAAEEPSILPGKCACAKSCSIYLNPWGFGTEPVKGNYTP